MKKAVSFLLSILFLIGTLTVPIGADAATASSKAGRVVVSSGNLNVRNSASTSGAVVTSLGAGSYVTLLSKSGSWWRVEYAQGVYGYCHANYITALTGSTAAVQLRSGSLNVRSGAGTSYSRVGSLTNGEVVIVLSNSGSWSRILYHGTKVGYVSSQYLNLGSTGYAAVSLNVPSFKQTDSRWANVTIGNTGKTIGKIGCATTAVAMMESYRAGKNIYPDTMSKQLSYSASGDLYWPGDYTAVTSGSGYLSGIYAQLKQGKAVLLGLKKASGGQHWVVVTGYTGGNTLTASGFTVNDPGSSYRGNLQQVLNVYSNFYKYFTYP